MENNLLISEKFYSIQGEGQTMGVPSVFIRLTGCNLLCKSDSWICDSIEVWRKGNRTNFKDVLSEKDIEHLRAGAHLVITGGEPLLHQKQIVEFLKWFSSKYFFPIVEIETNGTIIAEPYLVNVVHHWNVSPKLENSGEPWSKRFNEIALNAFNNKMKGKVIFKFVIEKELDYLEILQEFSICDMRKVVLMPAGATQEELAATRPLVAELCKEYNFRYSERLHIGIWNKKTGV